MNQGLYNQGKDSKSQYLLLLLLVSMSQCHAHSRSVVFHALSRGQRDTILCPYLVSFSTLYYLPLSQPRSLPPFLLLLFPSYPLPLPPPPLLPPPSPLPLPCQVPLTPTTASPPVSLVYSPSPHIGLEAIV